jgi:hypothetical protein
VIFPDKKGTQCVDNTDSNFICKGLYQWDGCIQGYVCDDTTGTCNMTDPGEGDTKENCEASCGIVPPPEDQYTCNLDGGPSNYTCDVDTSGNMNSDDCDETCGDGTPQDLVGLFRGLDVQTDFDLGEWVMNFTATGVTWGPYGDATKYSASVSRMGGNLLGLLLDSGDLLLATYSSYGWPTGPETGAMTFAVTRDGKHQTPSMNTQDNLGDLDFDVFVMNKCNAFDGQDSECDFTAAFASAARKALRGAKKEAKIQSGDDSCVDFTTCGDCVNDAHPTCGWCDGLVTDQDGNTICGADGNGCCAGEGASYCHVQYRKQCNVTCNWEDYENPTCAEATTADYNASVQTWKTCDDMDAVNACVFAAYCDTDKNECAYVDSKDECDANPMCNSTDRTCDSTCGNDDDYSYSYDTTEYRFCDPTQGCQGPVSHDDCVDNPYCDLNSTSCNPSECKAFEFYTCDDCSTPQSGDLPDVYYNTTDDCEKACASVDLTGVWRGIRIDQDFQPDEWDFKFDDKTFTGYSKSLDSTFTGTYTIGEQIDSWNDKEYTFKITMETETGDTLVGVVDQSGTDGPITKYMYLGLPGEDGEVTSFDDAMQSKNDEFVLISCSDSVDQCDFSKADPTK